MQVKNLEKEISSNEYPGRGIIIGKSADGENAVAVYWIMGRSENSRNRVFVEEDGGIKTQAFDPSKLTDPSLIIYSPVRVLGNDTIVTNGDQTDTIYDGLKAGLTFEKSLRSRRAEPDAPNYTPRISSVLHMADGYDFELSILKSDNGDDSGANRYTFAYENPKAGIGRYIHTYMGNGNPLPSFEGEPDALELNCNSIDELTDKVWNALNEENKVSLFVRFINIKTHEVQTRIVNKNK